MGMACVCVCVIVQVLSNMGYAPPFGYDLSLTSGQLNPSNRRFAIVSEMSVVCGASNSKLLDMFIESKLCGMGIVNVA